MEKQMKWKVTVDGEEYAVECVTMKTLYEVYVDGELAIKVPRKMKNDDSDSEYDLRIGRKRCQIVVYDGEPDLCVDGILLGAQRQLDRQERRNRWLKILGGITVVILCSYATFLWFIYEMAGEPIFGGVLSLAVILLFLGVGLWLLLSAIRKKKEY